MARRTRLTLGVGGTNHARAITDPAGMGDTVAASTAGSGATAWSRGLAWYQNKANVGVPDGTTLTTQGAITISTDGLTFEGVRFTGKVVCNAANVTFRYCRFESPGVDLTGTGFLVERCDGVWPADGAGYYAALNSAAVGTIRRCTGTGTGELVRIKNYSTVEDCYFHSMLVTQVGRHAENIMAPGGTGGSILRCWIDSGAAGMPSPLNVTGCINMSGFEGTFSGWTIEGNHLTGAGYLLGPGLGGPNVYRDNTFGITAETVGPHYQPMTLPASDTWSNNTIQPAGTVVPRPGS